MEISANSRAITRKDLVIVFGDLGSIWKIDDRERYRPQSVSPKTLCPVVRGWQP